jgi:hypothetical protein
MGSRSCLRGCAKMGIGAVGCYTPSLEKIRKSLFVRGRQLDSSHDGVRRPAKRGPCSPRPGARWAVQANGSGLCFDKPKTAPREPGRFLCYGS